MNKFILAGAAALALAVPAVAQDAVVAADANGNVYVLTDAQQSMYDGWPADRQATYTAWPETYRTYYWTLTPAQAEGWWMLTDEQRGRVYAMTPEQRVQAWTAIQHQMSGHPAALSANASTTATVATDAAAHASTTSPHFVAGEVVQSTGASATAGANLTDGSDLPVCSANQQDGCINSWEKNKTGTRPLGYWPGKPASEMKGAKPVR